MKKTKRIRRLKFARNKFYEYTLFNPQTNHTLFITIANKK